MTEYVATRWYRAPEIMLSFGNYVSLDGISKADLSSIVFLGLDSRRRWIRGL